MKDLDKELCELLGGTYIPAQGKYPANMIDEYCSGTDDLEIKVSQIKTVILEALKAEMPKRKKSVENMGNEMGGSFIGDDYNELYRAEDFGYNQAIDDCLKVCNKLLGDSK